MKYFIANNKSFYGLSNEFGTDGFITKSSFITKKTKHTKGKLKLMQFFEKFIALPKSMKKDQENE